MKRNLTLLLSLLLSAWAFGQQLYVGTYNVRYENSGDSVAGNVWSKRCQVICDLINFEHPDIFGTQEVLHPQLENMKRHLDQYNYIGVGRDDGKQAGEYAAIFYDTRSLTLLDDGHFWLSPTPSKPGLGWDAACVRICTWGKFLDKRSQKPFYFFNVHMDHIGVVARRESAKLIISRIRQMAKGAPVVLTGDFNVDQRDEIYGIFSNSGLLKDSYASARLRLAENGTYNDFNPNRLTSSRIDHVFVSPSVTVDRYGILTESYWTTDKAEFSKDETDNAVLRNPSDHYPVFVHLVMK